MLGTNSFRAIEGACMYRGIAASSAVGLGLLVSSVVAVAALVVWLLGLALALRGSAPAERAAILRAYATVRVPGFWRGWRG
jgi:hypothetical protein